MKDTTNLQSNIAYSVNRYIKNNKPQSILKEVTKWLQFFKNESFIKVTKLDIKQALQFAKKFKYPDITIDILQSITTQYK